MRVARDNLSVLFNRLYDRGEGRVTISHPADEIGDLVTIDLEGHDECTVRFETDAKAYARARDEVRRRHPETVAEDLPSRREYVNAVMASGLVPIANYEEVDAFVSRYGDPDLIAGHPPVFVGLDTNLMPWRIDRILGLRDPEKGVGYVNGLVVASGVRDELTWDYKCHDTDPFVDAFGDAFEEYWNQPLGSARIGRQGLLTYRAIRDVQQGDEIHCDRGDENIVAAYDEYDHDRRGQILLLSNDRNFIERARSHTLLAHHIEFPHDLPRKTTATWAELEHLLYRFALLFGVLELPAVTVHGVWRGKDQLDWQRERIKLDVRSPKLAPKLECDLSIVETYEERRLG